MKNLVFHLGAFALASVAALSIWLKDEKADATASEKGDKVVVWNGSPESIERIRFEGPGRSVSIEPKKDGTGRFFVVSVDKEDAPRSPHGHGAPDAGAPPTPKQTKSRFVGVKAAGELAEKLAPLTALRAVGKYDAKQAEEFGFDKSDGTLTVKIGGVDQSLVLGGTTPGGQERYARHGSSGQLYAVSSEVAQLLLGAENRLVERELHAFDEADVTRIRVSKGSKSREIVALKGKKGAYADAATPDKADETAGNWMTKVGRLKVMDYVESPAAPLTPESQVVRLEYFGGTKSLGFLELYKVPGEKASEYLMRSEQSRWHVKVLSNVGEQVEQDLGSVLK